MLSCCVAPPPTPLPCPAQDKELEARRSSLLKWKLDLIHRLLDVLDLQRGSGDKVGVGGAGRVAEPAGRCCRACFSCSGAARAAAASSAHSCRHPALPCPAVG